MKIVYPKINTKIELIDQFINVLIIENPELLYSFIYDIKQQINNCDGKTVFSINDEVMDFHKNIELISDPFSIDLNSKTLIKKITSTIEKVGLSGEYFERTQLLLADIETYFNDLCLEVAAQMECDEVSLNKVLKSADIKILDEYDSLVERIYAYMELVREFEGDKLFIILNMPDFVEKKQLQNFANTLIGHSFKVLLISSHDFDRLENENRLVVDYDLCEF